MSWYIDMLRSTAVRSDQVGGERLDKHPCSKTGAECYFLSVKTDEPCQPHWIRDHDSHGEASSSKNRLLWLRSN